MSLSAPQDRVAAGRIGRPRASHSTAADAITWRLLALLGCTALAWLTFQVLTDGIFFTPRNLSNLTVQMSITALVAVGMTFLLIAREIDLSVGSIVGVVTVVSVYVQVRYGWSMPAAVALSLAVGLAVGAFQGFAVTALRIPSFIVTLAAFSYLRGLAFVVSGAVTLSGTSGSFYEIANGKVPATATLVVGLAVLATATVLWIRRLGLGEARGRRRADLRLVKLVSAAGGLGIFAIAIWTYSSYRGLPYPVGILAAVVLLAVFVSRNTAFGRHVYAIGGNPEAARRAGINVSRTIFVLFVIVGLLSAVGGVIQASRLDAGPPTTGLFLALDAISAAIIGGTSLFGGYGNVIGTLLGALLLATILNGLSLMGVSTFYQYIAIGIILLVAVGIDSATQRRTSRE